MTPMNAVGWFNIYVNDLPRAVPFYESVLDITLEDMGDPTNETEMKSFPSDMGAMGQTWPFPNQRMHSPASAARPSTSRFRIAL